MSLEFRGLLKSYTVLHELEKRVSWLGNWRWGMKRLAAACSRAQQQSADAVFYKIDLSLICGLFSLVYVGPRWREKKNILYDNNKPSPSLHSAACSFFSGN
jgi:hypothetical protein